MSKHRPTLPTTCDVSDLLCEIVTFVERNPNWIENPEDVNRMASAYHIFTMISNPGMVTDEEYEFVMNIHTALKEAA